MLVRLSARTDGVTDQRDLAQVLEHEGPLPHPVQGRAQ
jgi:hypothetical protein